MQLTILSSGSKGNALIVQSGNTSVMIDAGLQPKTLSERMKQANVDAGKIKALCITHNHYDHAKCAAAVAESLNIPTLATEACGKAHLRAGATFFAHQIINPKSPVQLGPLTVKCFSTPHDAPGSVGFVFEDQDSRMALLTDLGHVHNAVVDAVRDVNLLYVEFNYDLEMLRTGPYPAFLKNRVMSNHGHLSNEQGADLVARSRTSELTHVVLAHLSEVNNTPERATAVAQRALGGGDVRITIAPQHEAMGPLEVSLRKGPRVKPLSTVALRMPLTQAPPRSVANGMGLGPSAQLGLFASAAAKP